MDQLIKKYIHFLERYWTFFTIVFLILISFFSLYPAEENIKEPGWSDKFLHLVAYSILSLTVGLKKPKNWISILLIFAIYSGLIELIQPFINRYGEFLDFLFNIIGIILGFNLGRFIKKHY